MNVGLKMVGDLVVFVPHRKSAHYPIIEVQRLIAQSDGDTLDEALDALKTELKREILKQASANLDSPQRIVWSENPDVEIELTRQFYACNH